MQNNYYQQPINPYWQPQYQNFQAQQRQEQLDQLYARPYSYNYVRDENEARNWPTAPGNHLVFENQNGQYFYTKSLGFSPNEKPVFAIYKREDYVEPVQATEQIEQNPLKEEFDSFKSSNQLELEALRKDISDLKDLFNSKPYFDKNHKKGGRD